MCSKCWSLTDFCLQGHGLNFQQLREREAIVVTGSHGWEEGELYSKWLFMIGYTGFCATHYCPASKNACLHCLNHNCCTCLYVKWKNSYFTNSQTELRRRCYLAWAVPNMMRAQLSDVCCEQNCLNSLTSSSSASLSSLSPSHRQLLRSQCNATET